MKALPVLLIAILLFAGVAIGAGHYIKIEVNTPKDGAILDTNVTLLDFTVEGDVSSEVLVTLNGKDVFNATAPAGTQTYSIQLELRFGSNTVYVAAFNSSAGIGDLSKIEIWYKGEEGLPIRWVLEPQRMDVHPGDSVQFSGALYGYVVWNPPVLRALEDRTIQIYLKSSSQIHDYGDLVGEATTDELGEFSFTYTFNDEGVYLITFRYAGDDIYAPGTIQAEVNVTSSTGGGGGSGGGTSGHAPARGVWIVAPHEGDVLSGTIMVEVISTEGIPNLCIDSEDLGEMVPSVFSEHYYAILDTTQFPDGEHVFTVKAGEYQDAVTVEFSNAPAPGETVKVEIIAPHDGAAVPPAFKLVFAMAWENVPEPSVVVYVDGSPLPGLGEHAGPPPGFANVSEAGEKRCVVPIVLDSPGNHTIRVVATSDNVSVEDQITVYAKNETGGSWKGAEAYVTADGWYVKTPPEAVVVYMETGSGVIFGEQRGVGRWFIPAPSSLCLEVSPANITVVYVDGSTEDITPSFSLSGAVDWLTEEHSIPTWAIVLIVLIVAIIIVKRWSR